MDTIDALVIDDEVNVAQLLVHFLEKYCLFINVKGVAHTMDEGIDLIDQLKPQVLFLDIELDDGTGFDLLDKVQHDKMKVIFVTAFNDFAVKAFKYNALDYLVKPVQIDELVLSSNKAFNEINKEEYTQKEQLKGVSRVLEDTSGNIDFIAVPSQSKIDFIKFEDIIYLQSEGRYTIFNLVEGKAEVSVKNLGEYESLLEPHPFFRIHNSYMINLKHVKNIDRAAGNYCEMSNGKLLPIARRRLTKLEKFLNLK